MILWCVEADEKTWRISWFWNILTYSYDILPWFYDVVHSYSKDRLCKGWRSMWRELRLSRVMSNIWHKYMVQKCFRFWGVGARPTTYLYIFNTFREYSLAGTATPQNLKHSNHQTACKNHEFGTIYLCSFLAAVVSKNYFSFSIFCAKQVFSPFTIPSWIVYEMTSTTKLLNLIFWWKSQDIIFA